MLVAAAVCPCPPLLVPEVAGGAAPELDPARAACYDALGVLSAARPERLVVAGPATGGGLDHFPAGTRGSLRGFGVGVETVLGPAEARPGEPELPPSLTVAAWLLERVGWRAAPVAALGLGEELDPARCEAAGRELAAGGERLALLVMGDGSTCRSPKAPGYLDERAADFDAAAARALAAADLAGLRAIDQGLAAELGEVGGGEG
ncbi:class III extradiol ring-cleavage dioxygenase family protein, partial [Streptomyces mayteni]